MHRAYLVGFLAAVLIGGLIAGALSPQKCSCDCPCAESLQHTVCHIDAQLCDLEERCDALDEQTTLRETQLSLKDSLQQQIEELETYIAAVDERECEVRQDTRRQLDQVDTRLKQLQLAICQLDEAIQARASAPAPARKATVQTASISRATNCRGGLCCPFPRPAAPQPR